MTGRIGKLQRFCPTHNFINWQDTAKKTPSFTGMKALPNLVAVVVVAAVAPIEVVAADS